MIAVVVAPLGVWVLVLATSLTFPLFLPPGKTFIPDPAEALLNLVLFWVFAICPMLAPFARHEHRAQSSVGAAFGVALLAG